MIEKKLMAGEIQQDDGSRNALDEFLSARDENTYAMIEFLKDGHQYFKARVFLELLWEYEQTANGR